MPLQSAATAADIAKEMPAAARPAKAGYQAGGSIGALHETLEQRLAAEARLAAPAQPVHWSERAVSLLSRALGPVLLIAGYFVVARLLF
ncbi:hypothetical protein GCM10007897_22550 [Sphingobium jiangsuense]|uniref:Uncharacterized protein n=1 Tax=Sphingobium jiangsuense TaxID=870476 RepID=A0A7W6FNT4_9SPHN|nr:hypothetical protein [Sphingobium jiangsuense]MBB3924867.1 hypothetical protein [Sphingobium jiangsuense]GLT00865.1 hypothetical protein GCM10007897_22550 [Sphingobium jiangsuense]